MSDPLAGGAAKVAEEMLQEVQQAVQEAEKAGRTDAIPSQQFSQVLETQNAADVQGVQPAGQVDASSEVLRTAARQRAPEVPAIGQSLNRSPIRSGMHRLFEDIMRGQTKYDRVLKLAMSGHDFNHSELLALQAGVYRFSQELEITSKIVEKGTSAVKQTLNTQV